MEEPNQTHERWRDNALTIPNLISILRLAAVPVFVWLLVGENKPLAAAALLEFWEQQIGLMAGWLEDLIKFQNLGKYLIQLRTG
ncbi:MAG: hypothetical protein CM15mP49_05460 [Actinomycetota bacterium]|nr:MAG: hypothetical protein CM15mP49_05460 [Actinomycetota bacterium]